MPNKEQIRDIVMLYIAWTGESKIINTEDIDSAVDFIIDSMQEEPVSEDLLIAARRASVDKPDTLTEYLMDRPYDPIQEQKFIEGARWKEQQIMKKAVEKRIETNFLRAYLCMFVDDLGFEPGDEVKVIIIKENKEDKT